MRDTGPIRVRRGGDDSRVSSYLGLARKILGEVKQRAAAGGLATLYRALTLSDGTWIRVGTVHGQDLVEIVPVGGGEEERLRPGFIALPNLDPITDRLLYQLNKGWKTRVDPRLKPGNMNWYETIKPYREKYGTVLQWLGPTHRYINDTSSNVRGDKIKRDGYDFATAPGDVYGACLHKKDGGGWFVRAVTGTTALSITISEAAVSAENGVGEWETIGSLSLSTYEANASESLSSSRCKVALWNGSGTSFVYNLMTTRSTQSFVVVSVAADGTISAVKEGESPYLTITLTRVYSTKAIPDLDFSWSCGGSTITYSLSPPYSTNDIYTNKYAISGGSGPCAYDWDGDDLVYATVEAESDEYLWVWEFGTLDQSGSEWYEYCECTTPEGQTQTDYGYVYHHKWGWSVSGDDLLWGTESVSSDPEPPVKITAFGNQIVSGRKSSLIGGTFSTQDVRWNYGFCNGCSTEDCPAPETYNNLSENNVDYVTSLTEEYRHILFLDLRQNSAAWELAIDSHAKTRTHSGLALTYTEAISSYGEKHLRHAGYSSSETVGTSSSSSSGTGSQPGQFEVSRSYNLGIGLHSAIKAGTRVASSSFSWSTNPQGDLLCSSNPKSGQGDIKYDYLSGDDPRAIAGLGAPAYLTEITAVGT